MTRGVEVAKHLSSNYDCQFMGYSHRYAEVITEAGFTLHRLAPELTEKQADQLLAVDQGRAVRHPFTTAMLATRVANERHLIRELGAQAVVIGTTLSQLISARAENVPLIYVKPFAYSGPHLRGLTSLGLPDRHTVPRVLDSALAGTVRRLAPRITLRPRSFTHVAALNGMRLAKHTVDLLEADLNLITTVSELLPPGVTLPGNYVAVGPIFARLPGEVPASVRRLADHPDPVVYAAMGSSGHRDIVLKVLNEVAKEPVQVLAPVADLLGSASRDALPANVHLTSWLPADRLGSIVDMAVTHGGEGTVQNSAVSGWPFIGIPLQFEQRYNVQTAVRAGMARMLSPQAVARPGRLAAEVDSVLHDQRMADAASRMSRLLAPVDGAANAAQAIREYLTH